MKLFYSARTRSTRPRWILEELGVSYDMVQIDLKSGQHKSPEYLKVCPMGYVPAFQDGGVEFFESGAIVAYLADKYIDKKLAPAFSSPDRAKYQQWMYFSTSALDGPIVGHYYHSQLLPEGERVPGYPAYCQKQVTRAAKVVSDHLEKNPYMMGAEFSAADILVASNISFAKSMKLIEEFPVLLDYAKRMTSRPAFQRAIA